jgi:hypothetical protein
LKKSRLLSTTDNTTEKRFNFELTKTEDNIFIYGAGSLIVFKIFGGKLRQVVPSHLFYPGAFAKMSVPALGKNYAGKSAKRKLNILGECIWINLLQTRGIGPHTAQVVAPCPSGWSQTAYSTTLWVVDEFSTYVIWA